MNNYFCLLGIIEKVYFNFLPNDNFAPFLLSYVKWAWKLNDYFSLELKNFNISYINYRIYGNNLKCGIAF